MFRNISLFVSIILLSSCGSGKAGSDGTHADTTMAVSEVRAGGEIPSFNEDSAYLHISRQVGFGPRVPRTKAHTECANYIVSTLHKAGADTIITQNAMVSAYIGDALPINNIMGRFNSGAKRKVLLLAHYDTRPWADNEEDPAKHNTPIDGANDGASGVGVLLEIARLIGQQTPEVGVDILLVDAEDYGKTEGWGSNESTWCLGTQHWVNNMPYATKEDRPVYGILLDMVGGRGARFHREYISNREAPDVVDRVWSEASVSPYASVFVNDIGGGITDDHIFINRGGIPCIDIIECNNPQTGSFNPTWHRLSDNLTNIDRSTLKAVGQVVTNVIYKEHGK